MLFKLLKWFYIMWEYFEQFLNCMIYVIYLLLSKLLKLIVTLCKPVFNLSIYIFFCIVIYFDATNTLQAVGFDCLTAFHYIHTLHILANCPHSCGEEKHELIFINEYIRKGNSPYKIQLMADTGATINGINKRYARKYIFVN